MDGGSVADCLLAGPAGWCASRAGRGALLKTLLGILRLGHPLLTSARAMALLLILRAARVRLEPERRRAQGDASGGAAAAVGAAARRRADRLLSLVGAELRMRTPRRGADGRLARGRRERWPAWSRCRSAR